MNISSYCTNLHIDAYPRPCFVKQVNSHIHSLYPTVHSLWGGWLRTLPRWSFWSGVQHWWCHHAQTTLNIHLITRHSSSYCLWLINQERVLWAPEDVCLLNWGTLNSFYILLFLRAITISLSRVRRLKDYFWSPVGGGSRQSTCAWCSLTLTLLVRSFSSVAELAGCQVFMAGAMGVESQFVNRLPV